jgi:DNA-binding CsgD family transcriptional regulator
MMLQLLAPVPASHHVTPSRGDAGAVQAAQWFGPMLDEVDYGMVLLDDRFEVLHANHVARSDMDEHHPLQLAGGALRARRAADQTALHEALQSAARRGLRRLLTVGDAPHVVNVAVVPLAASDIGHAAAMLVMLGKRVVCGELAVQWFARNHALTQAETRVLAALCDGREPSDIACAQGTSLHTVRTQISSVRAKTGAGNIRSLLRQVAMLPPLVSGLRHAARDGDAGCRPRATGVALALGMAGLDFVDALPA